MYSLPALHSFFYALATDPKQYDADSISWAEIEGKVSCGTRKFFYDYLTCAISSDFPSGVSGKEILDIGCGTGWLVHKLMESGANSKGIDPSSKNVSKARIFYPAIYLEETTLEEFKTNKKYDIICALMVFNHIADIELGFDKIKNMLTPKGHFYFIIPDFVYFSTPRHGYALNIFSSHDEEYVVQTRRREGEIVDVIRSLNLYKESLTKYFHTIEEIPLIPSSTLFYDAKRFFSFQNEPIAHLFHAQR